MRRSPTEIFGDSEFFIQSLSKKYPSSRPKKWKILGLFSKLKLQNFDHFGKIVFFKTSIFLKVEEIEVAPQKFFTKTYECNVKIWKVIGIHFSPFILSEFGKSFANSERKNKGRVITKLPSSKKWMGSWFFSMEVYCWYMRSFFSQKGN